MFEGEAGAEFDGTAWATSSRTGTLAKGSGGVETLNCAGDSHALTGPTKLLNCGSDELGEYEFPSITSAASCLLSG